MLPALGQRLAYFSVERIKAEVSRHGIVIKESSLKVYLNEALRKGVVHDAGRGWYSRLSGPVPLDTKPLTKLILSVELALPLLDFSCWSTAQINPWMHHLLAQPVAFLYAPATTLDSVGETLTALGWQVAVDPKPSEAARLVRPNIKMVVLRPTRSKQPTGEGREAPIEKILVDLVEEAVDSALMDSSEAQGVIKTVLSRYLLHLASLQSYAERRGVKLKALEAIN